MHFSTVMPVELRSETEPLTNTRFVVESWIQVGLWNGSTEATVVGLGGTVEVLEEVDMEVVVLGAGGAVLVVEVVEVGMLELDELVEDVEAGRVLVVEGGIGVPTGVVEVVCCPASVVVEVGSRSGSEVVAAEQPPFAHSWPRGQTLHAWPSVHLVPGLSQHTASEA